MKSVIALNKIHDVIRVVAYLCTCMASCNHAAIILLLWHGLSITRRVGLILWCSSSFLCSSRIITIEEIHSCNSGSDSDSWTRWCMPGRADGGHDSTIKQDVHKSTTDIIMYIDIIRPVARLVERGVHVNNNIMQASGHMIYTCTT